MSLLLALLLVAGCCAHARPATQAEQQFACEAMGYTWSLGRCDIPKAVKGEHT
jgi:uncharacterized protein YcfL